MGYRLNLRLHKMHETPIQFITWCFVLDMLPSIFMHTESIHYVFKNTLVHQIFVIVASFYVYFSLISTPMTKWNTYTLCIVLTSQWCLLRCSGLESKLGHFFWKLLGRTFFFFFWRNKRGKDKNSAKSFSLCHKYIIVNRFSTIGSRVVIGRFLVFSLYCSFHAMHTGDRKVYMAKNRFILFSLEFNTKIDEPKLYVIRVMKNFSVWWY